MNEKIKWTSIRIIIPFNVGQISDKRITNIVRELESKGLAVASTINPNPSTYIFIIREGKENLIIEPQQISYISVIDDIINLEYLKNRLENIFDVLLMDDSNQFVINLEGHSETEDSHVESLTRFSSKFETSSVDNSDIYGVGYRFFIKTKQFEGDLKIEPMISNKSMYYYQLILNEPNKMPLRSFIDALQMELDKNYDTYLKIIKG